MVFCSCIVEYYVIRIVYALNVDYHFIIKIISIVFRYSLFMFTIQRVQLIIFSIIIFNCVSGMGIDLLFACVVTCNDSFITYTQCCNKYKKIQWKLFDPISIYYVYWAFDIFETSSVLTVIVFAVHYHSQKMKPEPSSTPKRYENRSKNRKKII